MILEIHHSLEVIENWRYRMEWDRYAFGPTDGYTLCNGELLSGWRHYLTPSRPLLVDVPIGSRVVAFERPGAILERLETFWERKGHKPGDVYGIDAEAVVGLARRGERGFKMATDRLISEMSRAS